MNRNEPFHRRMQGGFSLLELMTVVAVIGTLAGIAIPSYGQYAAEAEIGSALATIDGMRTNVDFLYGNGVPSSTMTPEALGADPLSNRLGTIESEFANDGSGELRFSFDRESSPKLNNSKLVLSRGVNGQWRCDVTGPGARYKPATCV